MAHSVLGKEMPRLPRAKLLLERGSEISPHAHYDGSLQGTRGVANHFHTVPLAANWTTVYRSRAIQSTAPLFHDQKQNNSLNEFWLPLVVILIGASNGGARHRFWALGEPCR